MRGLECFVYVQAILAKMQEVTNRPESIMPGLTCFKEGKERIEPEEIPGVGIEKSI